MMKRMLLTCLCIVVFLGCASMPAQKSHSEVGTIEKTAFQRFLDFTKGEKVFIKHSADDVFFVHSEARNSPGMYGHTEDLAFLDAFLAEPEHSLKRLRIKLF